MKVVLASASPRRRELLTQIGIKFEVIPSKAEEIITKQDPAEVVMELASLKAVDIAKGLTEECLVIGSDTVVVKDQKILGKPKNEEDAVTMLQNLADDTHQVYTGVCLIRKTSDSEEIRTFYEATNVTFYPMSEQEIQDYVATGDPMDKAGAYGIQGMCAKHIRGIEGDYNNVVGLPVARLYHEMKDWL